MEYTIPELPAITGTSDAQTQYATDIRADMVKAITRETFHERVIEVLARSTGISAEKLMVHSPVATAAQQAVNELLGATVARKIIDGNDKKHGLTHEKVARRVQVLMGWN